MLQPCPPPCTTVVCKYHVHYQSQFFPKREKAWENVTTLRKALGGDIPIYEEVFVIDTMFDYNFHHILVDSVARLIPFYHYLRRHPHIKIQVRTEETALNASVPVLAKLVAAGPLNRRRVFDLLGFPPERIVTGVLIARKLYLPNDIECMSPLRHALGLHQLTKVLQAQAQKAVKLGACDNHQSHALRRLAAGPEHSTKAKSRTREDTRAQKSGRKGNEVVLPPTRANIPHPGAKLLPSLACQPDAHRLALPR